MRIHHLNCGTDCPLGGALFDGRSVSPLGRLVCHCLLIETDAHGLVLIDTDWSSLVLDVGAPGLSERVQVALRDERGRPSNVGRRLDGLAEAAGLTVRARSQATQTWSAWDPETDELVGGLYGVKVEGLFAGESMFHRRTDASKVALVGLVERLRAIGAVLLDVQWQTAHLASLGAVEVPRAEYLVLLEKALATPTAPFPDR